MTMKIFFVKTPKPKQFHFKPRYYDKKKEELKQRKMELGIIDKDTKGDPELRLRTEINRKWRNDKRSSRKSADLQRLIIFAVIVLALIYFIFIK